MGTGGSSVISSSLEWLSCFHLILLDVIATSWWIKQEFDLPCQGLLKCYGVLVIAYIIKVSALG